MTADHDHFIQRFIGAVQIAHHIPGRIRLRLSGDSNQDLGGSLQDAKRFVDSLSAMAGIQRLSLNILAKSCTVDYDISVIPFGAWGALLAGSRTPESDILLHMLTSAAQA